MVFSRAKCAHIPPKWAGVRAEKAYPHPTEVNRCRGAVAAPAQAHCESLYLSDGRRNAVDPFRLRRGFMVRAAQRRPYTDQSFPIRRWHRAPEWGGYSLRSIPPSAGFQGAGGDLIRHGFAVPPTHGPAGPIDGGLPARSTGACRPVLAENSPLDCFPGARCPKGEGCAAPTCTFVRCHMFEPVGRRLPKTQTPAPFSTGRMALPRGSS